MRRLIDAIVTWSLAASVVAMAAYLAVTVVIAVAHGACR